MKRTSTSRMRRSAPERPALGTGKEATMAELAEQDSGTAYLYWKTKDDLLLGLFARDFLAAVDGEIDALTADPDLARPHRLCPRLVRFAVGRPFVQALQTGDADLL